jgi:catechol 2,3-dioxygenase-like lactoylglutathione lyase family enzyme
MSATEVRNTSRDGAAGQVDMHLEVQIIPVSEVDRAKQFYQRLGWRLHDDVASLDGLRVVQFTPPGSAASITSGLGLTTAEPGSAEGGFVVGRFDVGDDQSW